MDIAKIRKKLKDAGVHGRQPKVNDKTKKSEDRGAKPADTLPEYSQEHDQGPCAERQTQSEQIMPGAEIIRREAEPVVREEIRDGQAKRESRAADTTKAEKAEEIIEMLTFRLLKEEFAFRISQLDEILRYQRITMVPKVPKYVLGITSLRGKIIPVIDLKLKLSLTDKQSDLDSTGKILILKGPGGPIGATVDKVVGVVRISKSEILPPPSHLSETGLKFIDGVAIVDKRFVSIINMEEVVANLK
jgi:purine-binding chemotaxis protein CheW